jgi:tetratricopeptide (TPR) repeat protein
VLGFRRLFGRSHRGARAAEAAGQYREAARLYAEAGATDEAANALLFLATRAATLRERAEAYEDALRFLPEKGERRVEVEIQIGLARIEDARNRGPGSAEERRVLAEAAARLEANGREADAATGYELLGRTEDLARCLEKAGDIERLEALLDAGQRKDSRDRVLRSALSEYELAMEVGQRLEARAALRRALTEAPGEPQVAELLRRLEARWLPPGRAELVIGGRKVVLVGTLPAALGRDAELTIRGASVSRRHAELSKDASGALVVRDLGSRNGTLVSGVPLGASLSLLTEVTIGLGEDVGVRLVPEGAHVLVEVERGPDRGARFVVGDGALRLPGVRGSVSFPDGHAWLAPDDGVSIALGARACTKPIVLLRGDAVELAGTSVEVPA